MQKRHKQLNRHLREIQQHTLFPLLHDNMGDGLFDIVSLAMYGHLRREGMHHMQEIQYR